MPTKKEMGSNSSPNFFNKHYGIKEIFQKLTPFLFSSQTYLAYGVEPSPTKFPLDKARYLTQASYVHEEYLKRNRKIKVLDIGCNEGMMILYCRKNKIEADFYGIDILQEKLDIAMKRGYQSTSLQDVTSLPFSYEDGLFDVVICSHILEHLEEPGKILEELNRVMRDGGLLIAAVPIGLLPGILWRQYVTPLYDASKRKSAVLRRFGHVNFFTLPRLKSLLKRHHFTVEEARGDFLIRCRKFFLENYKWWYDFNQWYGKLFPGILGHVNVKARLNLSAKKPAA